MRQKFLKVFALLSAMVTICYAARTSAMTVKLTFESEVEWIFSPWVESVHVPTPPFSIDVGDVIRGSIEFDPSIRLTGADNSTQPFSITLRSPSWSIGTGSYTGYVLDDRRDSGVNCDCPGTGPVSADDIILMGDYSADVSLPILDDRIELSRYLYPLGEDTTVPGAAEWRWQPAISLIGDTNTLHIDGILPTNPADWNAFEVKELRIGLVGPYFAEVPGYGWRVVGYQTFSARAAVTSFISVPEASCAWLSFIAAIGWRRTVRTICPVG